MASEKTENTVNTDSIGSDDGQLNELISLIQGVLKQTQDRFQHMSDQVIRRIDEMTKRIDDLEKNISDVMGQIAIDEQ